MPTEKQIAANRRNAQNSTGPRTPEGKAVTRLNALKTGIHAETEIIRGEKKEDLGTLAAEYFDQFQPITPEERTLVDMIVRGEWLLRRMGLVEAEAWEAITIRARYHREHSEPRHPAQDILPKDFTRIQWRINSLQSTIFTTLDRLHALQAERQAQEPEPLTDKLALFREPSAEPGSEPSTGPAEAAQPAAPASEASDKPAPTASEASDKPVPVATEASDKAAPVASEASDAPAPGPRPPAPAFRPLAVAPKSHHPPPPPTHPKTPNHPISLMFSPPPQTAPCG